MKVLLIIIIILNTPERWTLLEMERNQTFLVNFFLPPLLCFNTWIVVSQCIMHSHSLSPLRIVSWWGNAWCNDVIPWMNECTEMFQEEDGEEFDLRLHFWWQFCIEHNIKFSPWELVWTKRTVGQNRTLCPPQATMHRYHMTCNLLSNYCLPPTLMWVKYTMVSMTVLKTCCQSTKS